LKVKVSTLQVPKAKKGFNMYLYDQHDFQVLEEINSGGFGEVTKARNLRNGTMVAVKKIKCNQNGIPPMVIREIAILLDLNHPNIVSLRVL
jgi:serine/threonine protein kinase